MDADDLDKLRAKYEGRYEKFRSQLKESYASLKKKCAARVVRWQWASSEWFSPEPFYFELSRLRQGRLLARRPGRIKQGMCQYGFDGAGKVVVVRECQFGNDFSHEFFWSRGDVIEGAKFDESAERKLVQISRQFYKKGRLVRFEWFMKDSSERQTLSYRDGRIVASKLVSWMRHYGRHVRRFEMEYDRIGRLAAIYERGDMVMRKGGREVRYKRPGKGESIAELAKVVEEKLVELIPAAVAKSSIKGPAYCLVLAYDLEGNDLLPPLLGVGLEKERAEWMKRGEREAREMMWNPAEFKHFGEPSMELEERDLLAACGMLNQMLSVKRTAGPAKKVLNRVAARLMKHDWDGVLEVTRDFVVFAVDLEGVDRVRNMKESVGRSSGGW
jgi:hypothetical protein